MIVERDGEMCLMFETLSHTGDTEPSHVFLPISLVLLNGKEARTFEQFRAAFFMDAKVDGKRARAKAAVGGAA